MSSASNPSRPKWLSKITLTCPCCKKERNATNTPLLDQELRSKDAYRFRGTAEEQKEAFMQMAPYLATAHSRFGTPELNMANYLYQWACNACIQKRRALLADVNRQYVMGMGSPMPSYMHLGFRCKKCRKEFMFSASEQKFWYEDLHLSIDIHPINCAACRKTVRHEKYLHARLAELLRLKPLLPEHLKEIASVYAEMGNEEKAGLFERRFKNALKRKTGGAV
jgi:hypothetical protein